MSSPGNGSFTTKPLNVTEDELDFIWERLKEDIGSERVWESDDLDLVQSLHTKVHDLKGIEDE